MPAIAVRDLHKQYPTPRGAVRALRGISFALAEGALCAIVGPSGSGKSTLLGLVGGLDSPTSGEIHVGAFALHRMSPAQRTRFRAARIGLVFQSNNLVAVLTAAENVALPLTLLRLSARERSCKVDALLEELGLREIAHQRPGELSGGQQQRVGIARALVTAPALVLADEPTAHLDSRTGREVMDVIRSTNRLRGTTFVFSTHDPAMDSIADERVVLRDGVIVPEMEGIHEPWPHSSALRSATFSDIPDARPSPPPPSPWASCS
jgi:putative ABC transport system ATP-binding protein